MGWNRGARCYAMRCDAMLGFALTGGTARYGMGWSSVIVWQTRLDWSTKHTDFKPVDGEREGEYTLT